MQNDIKLNRTIAACAVTSVKWPSGANDVKFRNNRAIPQLINNA